MTDADNGEAKKTLLAQAETMGMKVNPNWKVETLAKKIAAAQEKNKKKTADAVRKASDTWVLLLRDAYAVEDEKNLVGATIKVPADMARRWYKAGVAIPGDEPVE